MKKVLLLLILLLLPIGVFAKTCDTSKVTIKSINQVNKSNDVTELEEATFNDKTIGVNLSFSNVDDYIEYRIVLKNDSDEDYELDKNSVDLKLDFMEYSLKSEDNSNTIKKGQEKNLLLRIKYKDEVDSNKFVDGKYVENKNMSLNISNREKILNPKTTAKIIVLLVLLTIITISTIIVLKGNKKTKLLSLIIGLTLIPITTLAVCKCELKVDSHIEIKQNNIFCVFKPTRNIDEQLHYYNYQPGDTIRSLVERDSEMYYNLGIIERLVFDENPNGSHNILLFGTKEELERINVSHPEESNLERNNLDSIVKNYKQGCYYGSVYSVLN